MDLPRDSPLGGGCAHSTLLRERLATAAMTGRDGLR
jgi:hypothetical protein